MNEARRICGKICTGLMLACVIAVGWSCSKPPETASSNSSAPAKRKIRIGMVAKSEVNDVFQAAKTGAFDAAKELSDKYGADISIEWRTPSSEDANKQVEAIRALANEKVDGITVSCSDAATLTPAIDEAVDKGVPVVCFDSDAPDSKRLCDYGTEDGPCGQIIMRELARVMGEKGTVAILAGNEAAPNLRLRVTAAREELAKHPNMSELGGTNGVFHHEETPEKAVEAVDRAMAANQGKIDGWAMIGGWPLFTDHALKWEPGTVKCVSCDALPKQLEYLRNGQVQVLVSQDCYGWGHRTVEILIDKIINGKNPEQTKIPNPLTIVTKAAPDPSLPVEANMPRMQLDQFAGYWDKWLKK
ncbi:MAG: substrate-binding domain-containing protein [Planctomycetota bacterium]|nr:substrate-binding domain-containing protein [Planctomycetota bacterium]